MRQGVLEGAISRVILAFEGRIRCACQRLLPACNLRFGFPDATAPKEETMCFQTLKSHASAPHSTTHPDTIRDGIK